MTSQSATKRGIAADETAFTPHPDYGVFSDERLALNQEFLQSEIDGADEGLERTYLEQRMRLLQAERQRRKNETPARALILQPQALYGLAGDFVKAVDPYTESDPVAVLIYLLTK